MKILRILISLLALLFFLSVSSSLYAQCAMCRASVQSSVSNGGNLIPGLNLGIIYLAVIPYVMITAIAILWYRNSRRTFLKRRRFNTGI